jgi:hypothetical protein
MINEFTLTRPPIEGEETRRVSPFVLNSISESQANGTPDGLLCFDADRLSSLRLTGTTTVEGPKAHKGRC